jgi:hypothetical protein
MSSAATATQSTTAEEGRPMATSRKVVCSSREEGAGSEELELIVQAACQVQGGGR